MREIKVVPYTQDWRRAFEEEKKALLELGISEIAQIHDIGSTSVEGLAAKPIIDILVEVNSLASLDRNQKKIESLGYESKGGFGIEGRRYYRKGRENRTHQIHAFRISDPHVRRHLAFRDYLRENPAVREEYEVLKLKVALECDNDINRYCDGKSDFIKLHEAKALDCDEQTKRTIRCTQQNGLAPILRVSSTFPERMRLEFFPHVVTQVKPKIELNFPLHFSASRTILALLPEGTLRKSILILSRASLNGPKPPPRKRIETGDPIEQNQHPGPSERYRGTRRRMQRGEADASPRAWTRC